MEITRKYYPIVEAAKRINCHESDIIHLIANNGLDAYVFMNNFKCHDGKPMHLNLTNEIVKSIDCFNCLSGEMWDIYDINYYDNNELIQYSGYYAGVIHGLFYVEGGYIAPLEFGNENVILQQISTKKDTGEGDYPVDINFLSEHLMVDKSKICILEKDISDLSKIDASESRKTIAKKAELIPQLLKMMPEFNKLDLDKMPVAKIISLVEAAAAAKGIEIPKTDKQTWAKYLGRK